MLKKNLDVLLVGENYISFLLALQILKEGKTTLLLGDDRIHGHSDHFKYFSLLDIGFFRAWGEDLDLAIFNEENTYFKNSPHIIRYEHKQLLLGRESAYENLKECARKVPHYFNNIYNYVLENDIDQKEFDRIFSYSCDRVAVDLCRFKTIANLGNLSVEHALEGQFKNILDIFTRDLKAHESSEEKSFFIYVMRTIFHQTLSIDIEKHEIFHLLLMILSPRFEVDINQLNSSLRNLLELFGGHYRNCQIKNWSFDDAKPWSVELDSFEGLVMPKKIAFIGNDLDRLPVKMNHVDSYVIYTASLTTTPVMNIPFEEYHFKPVYIGTRLVFWKYRFDQESPELEICFRSRDCDKIQFVKDDIIALLKQNSLIKSDTEVIDIKAKKSSVSIGGEPLVNLLEGPKLFDCSHPFDHHAIKDVFYFGPAQSRPFGLLTTVMQAKNYRHLIV
jgi:hypothetical protein